MAFFKPGYKPAELTKSVSVAVVVTKNVREKPKDLWLV